MFCINCGSQVGENAKFCPSCGTKLDVPAIPAPAESSSFSSGSDSLSFPESTSTDTYENSFTSNHETTFADDTSFSSDYSSSAADTFADSVADTTADDILSGENEPVSLDALSDQAASLLADPVEEMAPKPRSDHGILVSNIPLSGHDSSFDDSPEDELLSDDIIPEPVPEVEPELPEPDFSDIFSTDDQTIIKNEEVPEVLPDPDPIPEPEPVISSSYSDPVPDTSFPAGGNPDNLDTMHIPAQDPAPGPYGGEQQTPPPFAPYGQNAPQFAQPAGPQYPGGGIPAPQPVPAPAYEEAAPKKTKVGAGRVFGASIVSFFAIIFLLTLSMAVCVKFGASGKVLRGRIEKLDKNTVLSAEYDNDELSNNLYKTLGIRKATHGNADKPQFKEYLSKSNMLEYVGENVKNYADYILEGKGGNPSVTSEDIKIDFFKENNHVADEVFDYKFDKEGLNSIEKAMDQNDVDKSLSVKEWNKKAGFDLKNISYALSYVTLGILLALVLVFFIWVAIIVDRKGKYVAGFFESILFISGIIMFIVGLGVIAGSAIVYAFTSSVIFYLIPMVFLWFGILALGIGFAELLLSGIFKMIKKSIKRKEKALKAQQNTVPEAVPAYN
ncbi:MAG: zinc-ribbon domain-containing protein [Ruminococcus sp.]|nr:zinc-ribbon domain-containing protein [Ruminococcus sp.]